MTKIVTITRGEQGFASYPGFFPPQCAVVLDDQEMTATRMTSLSLEEREALLADLPEDRAAAVRATYAPPAPDPAAVAPTPPPTPVAPAPRTTPVQAPTPPVPAPVVTPPPSPEQEVTS